MIVFKAQTLLICSLLKFTKTFDFIINSTIYNAIKTYINISENDLPSTMKEVLAELKHKLVLFIGDLGAGKTTSIKELLKLLKCEDIGSSPSYSIINEYKLGDEKIYHIDLYRLENPEEAFNLGIEDYLYSGFYCFVEWPQIIFEFIEEPYHILKIEIDKNQSRKITLA